MKVLFFPFTGIGDGSDRQQLEHLSEEKSKHWVCVAVCPDDK